MARLAALVCLGLIAAGCGDPATAPSLESLGAVEVRLVTPNEEDRGVLLVVTGPIREVRAAPGFTAYVSAAGDRTGVVLVREGGGAIPAGGVTVASISPEQPDTRYTIELASVAALDHSVRSRLDGYSLEVVVP